jgi:hypothetical protein
MGPSFKPGATQRHEHGFSHLGHAQLLDFAGFDAFAAVKREVDHYIGVFIEQVGGRLV